MHSEEADASNRSLSVLAVGGLLRRTQWWRRSLRSEEDARGWDAGIRPAWTTARPTCRGGQRSGIFFRRGAIREVTYTAGSTLVVIADDLVGAGNGVTGSTSWQSSWIIECSQSPLPEPSAAVGSRQRASSSPSPTPSARKPQMGVWPARKESRTGGLDINTSTRATSSRLPDKDVNSPGTPRGGWERPATELDRGGGGWWRTESCQLKGRIRTKLLRRRRVAIGIRLKFLKARRKLLTSGAFLFSALSRVLPSLPHLGLSLLEWEQLESPTGISSTLPPPLIGHGCLDSLHCVLHLHVGSLGSCSPSMEPLLWWLNRREETDPRGAAEGEKGEKGNRISTAWNGGLAVQLLLITCG